MAITVRELVTKLGFTTDTKKLDEFNNKVNLAKKRLEDLSQRSTRIGRNLTLGLTLPIAGLSSFALKAASDAEEIRSKFGTVFQDLRDESEQTAKQLAKDFGLSGTKARELIGNTGDLLTGFGFSQEAALNLSKQVNELAVDLASFTNFSGGAQGASDALTKALLGERESVKSLGISILEEDVKKQIAINTAKGLTFETERQAKAFATLQLAQQQSKNAIGDFSRTSASFANRMRIFRARLQDVAETFGNIILPPATALLNRVITLLEAFNDLSEGTKRFILIMTGMATVVGPIFLAFGFFAGALVKIVAAYQLLTKSVMVFRGAMISANLAAFAIPAAISAAVVAVFLIIEDLIAFFRGRNSVTGVIVKKFQEMVPKVVQAFREMVPKVVQAFREMVPKVVQAFREMVPKVVQAFREMVPKVVQAFREMVPKVVQAFREMVPKVVQAFREMVPKVVQAFMEMFTNAVNAVRGFISNFKKAVSAVFNFIVTTVKENLDTIKSVFGFLKDIMLAPFVAVKDTLMSIFGLIDKVLKSKLFAGIISGPTALLNKASGLLNKLSDDKTIQLQTVAKNTKPIVQKVVQVVDRATPRITDVAQTVVGQAPLLSNIQNAQDNINQGTVPPFGDQVQNKSQVFNISLDAPIQVDQLTTPENIGLTIQQGLESGLERVLRQTARVNAPALEF